MVKADIAGSIAHAAMLAKQGIIAQQEAEDIIEGLSGILADIQSGKIEIDANAEDIHTCVEAKLTGRLGDAGRDCIQAGAETTRLRLI